MMSNAQRKLTRVVDARPSSDGDGVKIYRVAGSDMHTRMDPFLMLDEICSEDGADYIGGFPSHPHRGFETITYMLEGAMRHQDHMGNEGVVSAGDVQWMTAARGVIHSEMPEQQDGLLHGFQLWLNLPAAEKMQAARYRDYRSSEFPLVSLPEGGSAKVLAGELEGGKSPVAVGTTSPTLLDIRLAAGECYQYRVNQAYNLMLYVYRGASSELLHRQMGFYTGGDRVTIQAGSEGVGMLLLAAQPLHEPIKQYGPFVMNTAEEIEQAISDYNRGVLVS
ncbi:MAG: pirin family protein [Spongiibacteraceae bacterium]